jgi:hypothetical protein
MKRLRQENGKFEASLDCIEALAQKKKKKKKKRERERLRDII